MEVKRMTKYEDTINAFVCGQIVKITIIPDDSSYAYGLTYQSYPKEAAETGIADCLIIKRFGDSYPTGIDMFKEDTGGMYSYYRDLLIKQKYSIIAKAGKWDVVIEKRTDSKEVEPGDLVITNSIYGIIFKDIQNKLDIILLQDVDGKFDYFSRMIAKLNIEDCEIIAKVDGWHISARQER